MQSVSKTLCFEDPNDCNKIPTFTQGFYHYIVISIFFIYKEESCDKIYIRVKKV